MTQGKKLLTKGFNALLVTQFLGAFNDNILKQIIALQIVGGIWKDQLGKGGQGLITIIFTLPFLIFSGWAGQLADRCSKHRVSQGVKIAEIALAIGALAALWLQSLWISVLMLLFLALQSTVFGPAKYGMLPELFHEESISGANAAINMLTNVSIILGILIAGPLSENYPEHSLLPGVMMLFVALTGFASSLFLTPLEARAPKTRFTKNPFAPYLETLKLMVRIRALLLISVGIAYFNFIGVLVLLAILDFKLVLGISDKATSLLNLPIALGIAVGSILAGLLSRNRIRLGLVPVGAIGLTCFLLMLGVFPLSYYFSLFCLSVLGVFGGLYLVPLQSLLQSRSPVRQRGRVMGTNSFLSFAFVAFAGAVYWFLRSVLHLEVQQMLILGALITLVISGYILWDLRRYLADHLFSPKSED